MSEESESEVVEAEVLPAEVPPSVPPRLKSEEQEDSLREIEDRLFEKAAGGVAASMRWAELDPGDEEPPDWWMAGYETKAEGMEAFRRARAGWLPKSAAPSGQAVELAMYTSMAKARAARGVGQVQLNIAYASFPASDTPSEEYDVIDED